MRAGISIAAGALLIQVAISFGAVLEGSLELRGIAYVPDPKSAATKLAVLYESGRDEYLIAEGERNRQLEIVQIVPENGKVTVRSARNGELQELSLPKTVERPPGAGVIQFESVHIAEMTYFYQQLSGQTIIASPGALEASMTFTTTNCNSRAEAVAALEGALNAQGLFLSARGEKFKIMVSDREEAFLEPHMIAHPPKDSNGGTREPDVIPPGLIALTSTDVLQVLSIYEDLTGRTVIRREDLPSAKITLKTQSAITRAEAVWLIDSAVRLRGIAMIPEAKKFVFAIRPEMTNGLPHFVRKATEAKAKTTNGLPHLFWPSETTLLPPIPKLFQGEQNSRVRRYQFDAKELIQMYGGLIGHEPLSVPPDFSRLRFALNPDHLDAPEAVYALEALAWANGVAFELVGTNKVGLSFLPKAAQ